jgi:hypothetical protein
MSARQDHGFINEAKVCKRNGLVKWKDFVKQNPQYASGQQDYTSVWDAIDTRVKTSGKYGYLPVQIKTIKEGAAVELGDIFRNSKKDEAFRLIVDFWDPSDNTKTKIVRTVDVTIDPAKWKAHFNFPDYDEWKTWIGGVSNCRSYDDIWKNEREQRKSDWNTKNPESLVTPTFKRDHKKQKRIQCSVNSRNFDNFIESVKKI